MLIDLNKLYYSPEGEEVVNIKIWMVLGEGSVFLVFLLTGLVIMQRTIKKEIALVRQQRNFLLSITHELKTPIAAIKLGIQTLLKRKNLPDKQREKLEKSALNNTERLHDLIDNVLLATRIESGQHPLHLIPTNLSDLTKKICQDFELSPGFKGELITSIEDNLTINVDSTAFESILINLLDNALKYGEGKRTEVTLKESGSFIFLEVSDQGPGIPIEERRRVFDKFYRMGNEETRSRKGTGIGLFIVKELVELHGGNITIGTNSDSGSTFIVRLPA